MSRLVTIFGGSGFLGRQVARIMAQQGWRVRVAVRRPNEALFVRTYGVVGQVLPVPCNIRDDLSTRAALTDADAVVNCVGIMFPSGKNTFDAVHEEAAGRIARLAAETGVETLVHVSALGADRESDSRYAASKGRGEAAMRENFPASVIMRPSVMFGPGDDLYERLGAMTRLGPIMMVPAANTRIQPVYVEDVARAISFALTHGVESGIYELGGPEVLTMRQIVGQVLDATGHRRLVLGMPNFLAKVVGSVLDIGSAATGGLVRNTLLTRDQVRLTSRDMVVGDRDEALPLKVDHIAPANFARQVEGVENPDPVPTGFGTFGITPAAAAPILPEYLWRFRDSGQYAEIKASAKNLRSDP